MNTISPSVHILLPCFFFRVHADAGDYLLDQAHTATRPGCGVGSGCIILYALPLARKGIFLYLASGPLLLLFLPLLQLLVSFSFLILCCCLSSCANGSSISHFPPLVRRPQMFYLCVDNDDDVGGGGKVLLKYAWLRTRESGVHVSPPPRIYRSPSQPRHV